MTLVQNTFSLVPDVSIANSNRHGKADDTYAHLTRPPMTTKQVKKAYRTSNKAPKLSKAQQRRLELFEQDRIRKGFEKEKNQARARAVRDKKREREERERAIKKKKGLPLVDVRPSQDTIARFVRVKPKSHPPDGASPLRNSEEECWDHNQIHRFDNSEKNLRPPENISDLAPTGNSHGPSDKSSILDYAIPPNKKRRVDDQIFFPVVDEVASPSPYPSLMGSITSNYAQRAPSPIAEQDRSNVHDSFSTVDLSEEDPPDDTLSEAKCVYCSSNALKEKVFWPHQCRGASSEFPVPESPEYHLPSANNPSIMLLCVECAARPTQLLPLPQPNPPPKPVIKIEKTPHSNAILEQSKQSLTSHSSAILTPSRMQESELNAPSSPPPRHPQSPAAISSASAKSKLDEQVPASHPKRPRFLNPSLPPADTPARRPRHSQVAKPNTQENELPSSTQLFIHSHLDDLLPSPSQEAREIFEEPQLEQTGSSGEAEFMGTPHNRCSETSLYTTGIPTMPRNCSMAPTPSIDFRESRHSQKIVDYSEPPKAAARPPVQLINQNAPSAFEIPFFSTQDLLLSSQDLKDIEDKPPPHIKTNTTPLSANVCISPQTTVQSSLKPLFTSTCREMRYKFALERSRTAAWEGPSARRKAYEELDRLQMLENKHLEAPLASRREEPKRKRNRNITTRNCAAELNLEGRRLQTVHFPNALTPRVQPRHARARRSPDPTLENKAQNQARMSSEDRRLRLGDSRSGSRTSQRITRPKSSYEAMLQLLTEGSNCKTNTNVDKNADGDGDSGGGGENRGATGNMYRNKNANKNQRKEAQVITTIPASQETDYDCGEEWDDDDLLCETLGLGTNAP